jgi:hypothetical protein
MDAKAPAAVTTFQRGCDARGHLIAMAVASLANAGSAAARAHLTPPSAV